MVYYLYMKCTVSCSAFNVAFKFFCCAEYLDNFERNKATEMVRRIGIMTSIQQHLPCTFVGEV